MKTIILSLSLLLIGGFLFQNFTNKNSNPVLENGSYSPTVLSNDTTQFWIAEGSPESDTVLIINEGGPKIHLSFEYSGKTQWSYLPNYSNYYQVHMHQAGTYNKAIFDFKNGFTRAMAETETENNSEMLYRAFKYFKDRKKTVIVVGHSYGAFIIPHCMSTRPLKADGYLITGGRIDDYLERSSYFLKGYNSLFEEDGVTFNPPDINAPKNKYRGERYFRIYRVKQLLKGVIGQPRYSKELADKDLSKMIYFYAKDDQNVGALLDSEVAFLKSKGVKVHATEGGHYEIWKRVVDAFEEGKVKF